jgi:hypothetical protein
MKKSALLVVLSALLLSTPNTRADSPVEYNNPMQIATLTNAISLVSPILSARGVSLLPTLRGSSSLANVSSYQINLSANTTFPDTTVVGSVPAPTTSFAIPSNKKLSPGQTYHWRIDAPGLAEAAILAGAGLGIMVESDHTLRLGADELEQWPRRRLTAPDF